MSPLERTSRYITGWCVHHQCVYKHHVKGISRTKVTVRRERERERETVARDLIVARRSYARVDHAALKYIPTIMPVYRQLGGTNGTIRSLLPEAR